METENSKVPKRIYVPFWMGVSILVIFVVLAAGIGVFLYKTYFSPTNLYDPTKQNDTLGSLQSLKISPGASQKDVAKALAQRVAEETGGKLTIIFFYDGYSTQSEALTQIAVMREALKEVEPFKSLPDLFTYKIFTTEGKKCHAEGNPRFLVCEKKLIESFQKLGVDHFKVVLLSPDDFTPLAPLSRGANSFITISTYVGKLPLTDEKRWTGIMFTQLLGRSLGLRNESQDLNSIKPFVSPPAGVVVKEPSSLKPNCAPDMVTAQKWWGGYTSVFPTVGYNQGCGGHADYYYPEKETLMSDLPRKQSYGKVSEDYLRGVLSCFYGGKEGVIFPAGVTATYSASLKSCDAFTKEYPSFWNE